jgi:hypothetical protein
LRRPAARWVISRYQSLAVQRGLAAMLGRE